MNHSETKSAGRKVLITGATGALGQSVMARFLAAGDSVIAVHSVGQKPAAVTGAEWIAADLTQRKSVFDIVGRMGDLDVSVHCAGGFRYGLIDSLSDADFRFLNALNFQSAYFLASAVAPGMKKRKKGVLLFISSMATINPTPGMSAYAATKAAVNLLVTSLAAELKADGVRVNAVLPSIIDTAVNRREMPHADPAKWVSPEDIAEILFDLTLSKSKSITGALIPITGRT